MELCGISGQPYDECDGLHEDECVWQCGQCGGNVYNCICPEETTPFIGVDVAHGKDKTVTMVVEKCSFDGCSELVCEADKESPDRMHFCQKHHDQLAQYVKENAIPKIIGFWVKANGGAKKLASTF
jgi:hypothetical protein